MVGTKEISCIGIERIAISRSLCEIKYSDGCNV